MFNNKQLRNILLAVLGCFPAASLSVPGVTDNKIVMGSVLPLEGQAGGLGQGMKEGLEWSRMLTWRPGSQDPEK